MNRTLTILVFVSLSAISLQAENLLKNADFSSAKDGLPSDWKAYQNIQKLAIDTTEITGAAKQSLRVDLVTDGGKSLGQIVQKVSVVPNTKYIFKVDMKSSAPGGGVGQIKLLVGSSEIQRIATAKSTLEWSNVETPFDSGEANVVWIVLRYDQEASNVGQQVWFANPVLSPAS